MIFRSDRHKGSGSATTGSAAFFFIPLAFALQVLLPTACGDSYTPKPRGYLRIDMPEKEYRSFDSSCPYSFEYPAYALIIPDTARLAEPYWINILFPGFRAAVHLSYKPVHGDLSGFLDDAHSLVNKHIPKANAITQREFVNNSTRVFGLEYEISGADAASPYQFYLTDSLNHFVRGALYFNLVPNNDSLAPVIAFIREDIRHMIATFRWKERDDKGKVR